MVLLRADDTAFWHMEERDVQWSVDAGVRKWLGPTDQFWLDYVLRNCPVLKFTRDAAMALDQVPRRSLMQRTCLGEVFSAALEPLVQTSPSEHASGLGDYDADT